MGRACARLSAALKRLATFGYGVGMDGWQLVGVDLVMCSLASGQRWLRSRVVACTRGFIFVREAGLCFVAISSCSTCLAQTDD